MRLRRRLPLVLAAFLFAAAAPAAAQSLDIGGPYGNADGCTVAKGGFVDGDSLLLLQPEGIQSYGTACEFVQVLAAKDGTKVVTGLCHFEGEDGVGVQSFVIRKSDKDPEALAVYDSGGSLWGELEPCP